MKSLRRSLTFLSAASVLLLSSCNRGFGCPTNLSLDELVSGVWPLLV
ncbi:hypothetical protein GGR26_000443 [Lewinella marina]|nr:hypothetical protein [Neolewinella marina]NJB84698.1 hypothetical protein [Neolewinella marina]